MGTVEFIQALAKSCRLYNFHWTKWTYKTINMGGWGLFDYYASMSFNLFVDSYESLTVKFKNGLTQW